MEKKITDNTREARDNFGHGYGSGEIELSKKEIEALMNGKCIAVDINGGEYVEFISMDKSGRTK